MPEIMNQHSGTNRIAQEVQNRGPATNGQLRETLRPYVANMLNFLNKAKTHEEITQATNKNNMYRQKKNDPPRPKQTLLQCLNTPMTWATSSEQRLLTFLCMLPDEVAPIPRDGGFVSRRFNNRGAATDCLSTQAPTAKAAIQMHGTPVRLLELFYRKMGVRLVIFQGAICRYVHVPDDWNTRSN